MNSDYNIGIHNDFNNPTMYNLEGGGVLDFLKNIIGKKQESPPPPQSLSPPPPYPSIPASPVPSRSLPPLPFRPSPVLSTPAPAPAPAPTPTPAPAPTPTPTPTPAPEPAPEPVPAPEPAPAPAPAPPSSSPDSNTLEIAHLDRDLCPDPPNADYIQHHENQKILTDYIFYSGRTDISDIIVIEPDNIEFKGLSILITKSMMEHLAVPPPLLKKDVYEFKFDIRRIGTGTFGEVFNASNRELGVEFVIKKEKELIDSIKLSPKSEQVLPEKLEDLTNRLKEIHNIKDSIKLSPKSEQDLPEKLEDLTNRLKEIHNMKDIIDKHIYNKSYKYAMEKEVSEKSKMNGCKIIDHKYITSTIAPGDSVKIFNYYIMGKATGDISKLITLTNDREYRMFDQYANPQQSGANDLIEYGTVSIIIKEMSFLSVCKRPTNIFEQDFETIYNILKENSTFKESFRVPEDIDKSEIGVIGKNPISKKATPYKYIKNLRGKRGAADANSIHPVSQKHNMYILKEVKDQMMCIFDSTEDNRFVYADCKLGNILFKCNPKNKTQYNVLLGDLGSAAPTNYYDDDGQQRQWYTDTYPPPEMVAQYIDILNGKSKIPGYIRLKVTPNTLDEKLEMMSWGLGIIALSLINVPLSNMLLDRLYHGYMKHTHIKNEYFNKYYTTLIEACKDVLALHYNPSIAILLNEDPKYRTKLNSSELIIPSEFRGFREDDPSEKVIGVGIPGEDSLRNTRLASPGSDNIYEREIPIDQVPGVPIGSMEEGDFYPKPLPTPNKPMGTPLPSDYIIPDIDNSLIKYINNSTAHNTVNIIWIRHCESCANVAKETMNQLFREPFCTTKGEKEGLECGVRLYFTLMYMKQKGHLEYINKVRLYSSILPRAFQTVFLIYKGLMYAHRHLNYSGFIKDGKCIIDKIITRMDYVQEQKHKTYGRSKSNVNSTSIKKSNCYARFINRASVFEDFFDNDPGTPGNDARIRISQPMALRPEAKEDHNMLIQYDDTDFENWYNKILRPTLKNDTIHIIACHSGYMKNNGLSGITTQDVWKQWEWTLKYGQLLNLGHSTGGYGSEVVDRIRPRRKAEVAILSQPDAYNYMKINGNINEKMVYPIIEYFKKIGTRNPKTKQYKQNNPGPKGVNLEELVNEEEKQKFKVYPNNCDAWWWVYNKDEPYSEKLKYNHNYVGCKVPKYINDYLHLPFDTTLNEEAAYGEYINPYIYKIDEILSKLTVDQHHEPCNPSDMECYNRYNGCTYEYGRDIEPYCNRERVRLGRSARMKKKKRTKRKTRRTGKTRIRSTRRRTRGRRASTRRKTRGRRTYTRRKTRGRRTSTRRKTRGRRTYTRRRTSTCS